MRNLNKPHRPENTEGEPVPFQPRETHREASREGQPENRMEHPAEMPQSLLPKRQVEELRSRWNMIQTNFIDEPRRAVKDADALVASAIKQVSEVFTDQRSQLEKQWSRGDEISTEDLRLALQQYRSFFSRLLSM